MVQSAKKEVQNYWEKGSCGEAYTEGSLTEVEAFSKQAQVRYRLEPYLKSFAQFEEGAGKKVLEIGVGMGADHLEWAKSKPALLQGIDLTKRAVNFTINRLNLYKFTPNIQQSDAESLPFNDKTFDIVYSWGVLHHSPHTQKAFNEVCRVLKPQGVARVMVYHTWSLTGLMLWARYALLKGRPFTSLATIYAQYLESPHTKAYTKGQIRHMFQQAGFKPQNISVRIQLNHGDLLEGTVGQRHKGKLLNVAKALWPRPLFKLFTPFLGLYLLIEAKK